MPWLEAALSETASYPSAESLSTFESHIDPVWIEEALAETGTATLTQARQRLGSAPLRWLFERCALQWSKRSAAPAPWHGLSVYAVDGSTLRVADSQANREHFGLAAGRSESGYPLVRLAALIAARSHLIVAAAFGPYSNSEHHYAGRPRPSRR